MGVELLAVGLREIVPQVVRQKARHVGLGITRPATALHKESHRVGEREVVAHEQAVGAHVPRQVGRLVVGEQAAHEGDVVFEVGGVELGLEAPFHVLAHAVALRVIIASQLQCPNAGQSR
jgi:hypothetical protein